jgi:hypothetical protein
MSNIDALCDALVTVFGREAVDREGGIVAVEHVLDELNRDGYNVEPTIHSVIIKGHAPGT